MDEEQQGGSDFDGILLEESTGSDEDAAGLELDAFQATEIRTIFLTTLPDYLEPVRQMLDQLLVADDPAEMRRALDTTLESIQTAASRVQIDDVSEVVEHMRAQLSGTGSLAEENRDSLFAGLARIERIVAEVATEEARPRSETIVSALARVGGIDQGVLEKLTAAGLVTVDQIRMADPGEIMAVSGLEAAVVARIVAAVAEQDGASSPEEPAVTREGGPTGDTLPGDEPAAADELETWLRRQVESELVIEERKGQLLHLRTNLLELQGQLAGAEAERASLEKSLARARTNFGDKLKTLSQFETRKARIEKKHSALGRELERITGQINNLQRQSQAVQDEQARFSVRVTSVTRTLDRLVRSSRGESSPGSRPDKS